MNYEQMSDNELLAAIAEKMCRVFKSPEIFNPFDDARDVQTVKDWAWERSLTVISGVGQSRVQATAYPFRQIDDADTTFIQHEGSRDSRHRAEARATIIAILKAVEAKEPTR